MLKINSPQLLEIFEVNKYGNNITYTYDESLEKFFIKKFSGYYIILVNAEHVEKLFAHDFIEKNHSDAFNATKWYNYIINNKKGGYYLLDAHDYIGFFLKYLIDNNIKINISFYGTDIFWLYHDIGHVYLNHLAQYGTFKHKDEMDASLFSIIKLISQGKFNEKVVISEIYTAIKPLLKTGKFMNYDDYQYMIIYMNYFKRLISNYYE